MKRPLSAQYARAADCWADQARILESKPLPHTQGRVWAIANARANEATFRRLHRKAKRRELIERVFPMFRKKGVVQ